VDWFWEVGGGEPWFGFALRVVLLLAFSSALAFTVCFSFYRLL